MDCLPGDEPLLGPRAEIIKDLVMTYHCNVDPFDELVVFQGNAVTVVMKFKECHFCVAGCVCGLNP